MEDGRDGDRDRQAPDRRKPVERQSFFLMAPMRRVAAGVDQIVRVRNLSEDGLMADCAADVQIGEAVEVTLRGIGLVAGRVSWAQDDAIGVAFDTPIDPLLARKPV